MRVFLLFICVCYAMPVIAQNDDLHLSSERLRALRQPAQPIDQDLYLGARLHIEQVDYYVDSLLALVYVDWNQRGTPIENIALDGGLYYKAEDDSWNTLHGINGSGSTDAEGYARVSFKLPSDQGLIHGEYALEIKLIPSLQTSQVQEAMQQDQRLYGDDLSISERSRVFLQLLEGKHDVAPAIAKLYVAGPDLYADTGTLNAEQNLRNRNNEVRTLNDQLWTMRHAPPPGLSPKENEDAINAVQRQLKAAEDYLELAGGPLSAAEKEIISNAQQRQYEVRKEIAELDDQLIEDYIHIIHGDFDYWDWKLNNLIAASVWYVITNNRWPWDNPELKLESATEEAWKKHLKQELEFKVNGDPSTWKENRGMMVKEDVPENRGGLYTEQLLTRMQRDVDNFTLSDFIMEDDKGLAFDLTHWMQFEIEWKVQLGMAGTGEGIKLAPFDLQAPQTTAQRINALNLADEHAYDATRFPKAFATITQAFHVLAGAPQSYRFTWLTHTFKQSGALLERSLGPDFPVEFRETSRTNKERHKALVREVIEQHLKLLNQPIYEIWFYSEGYGRTRANRDEELAKAHKRLEERDNVKPFRPDVESGMGTIKLGTWTPSAEEAATSNQ